MIEVCQKHSGMEEKTKTHGKDIVEIKAINSDQWEKITDHGEDIAAMKKDWPRISEHGETIAGMKRDIRIVMMLLFCILAVVIKLALEG